MSKEIKKLIDGARDEINKKLDELEKKLLR